MSKPVFKRVANSEERDHAMQIRRDVFIVEQGINESEEWDGLDDVCVHFIGISGGKIVGTARTRFITPGQVKIERMAVLKPFRRRGIGAGILACIEKELQLQHCPEVMLHAQVSAEQFYYACGYKSHGEHFDEANIEHVTMVKRLFP